jgi:glucosamine-6-phosphate deaminase
MRTLRKDKLEVKIFDSRRAMGLDAAETASARIRELLKTKPYVNIIFASAPSQVEFLEALLNQQIEWNRINAFHMDEYIGLDKDDPQTFGNFLKVRLFDKVPLRETHYLDGNATPPEKECIRYAQLLTQYPTDIVFLGIGQNTHLAFNDPHVAFFDDPEIVKVVDLDEPNRRQQVDDGCFKTLAEVPTHALTITIPALFKSGYAYAIAPGKPKANAIYHTLYSEIAPLYPSTILRKHPQAVLFIDEDSAEKIKS